MKKTVWTIVAVSVCILLMAGCKGKDERDDGHGPAAQSNPGAEKAAVECAEQWLAVLDQGDYQQAWEQTAGIFKEIVPIDQWRNQMKVFRGRLGKVVSRNLKSRQYTTVAPGVPEGQYVIIQYETAFENKANATETITPILTDDGSWKVSQYVIQ